MPTLQLSSSVIVVVWGLKKTVKTKDVRVLDRTEKDEEWKEGTPPPPPQRPIEIMIVAAVI